MGKIATEKRVPIYIVIQVSEVPGPAGNRVENEPSEENRMHVSVPQSMAATRSQSFCVCCDIAGMAPRAPVTVTLPSALGAERVISDATGASSRS